MRISGFVPKSGQNRFVRAFCVCDRVKSLALAGSITALCPRPPVAGFGPGLFLLREFFVAETFDRVIVDHSNRLHEGVTDGAPYEVEASLL